MLLLDQELQIENQLLEKCLNLPHQCENMAVGDNWSADSIPIDFKLQIAIGELSQLSNTLNTRKEEANKSISTLRVMLNETERRMQDVQRDAYDFQRDVAGAGKCANNPDRYQAEKFVRHMKRRILDQESALDKLRLKNCTFMSRKRTLEAQLNREEATSFHFIDYHQMQIKQKRNKKLLAAHCPIILFRKISLEKSKHRIDSLARTVEELNTKSKLTEKGIEMREAHLERLDESMYSKEDEVDCLKTVLKNKASPEQIEEEEPTGPDFMDYLTVRADIYELREKIKAMERRVDIAKGNNKLQQQKDRKKQITRKEAPNNRPARWTGRSLGL